MANMSYCRFRNTAHDLVDCLNALDPYEDEISIEEVAAGVRMFHAFLEFCADNGIIEEYDNEQIAVVFDACNAAIRENKETED